MYRVRSTDVWFNAPGVVAAYQPIAAPGPLLARYNQAHGGDNRYRAEDNYATPVTWSPVDGWSFPGGGETNAHYYVSGLMPQYPFTICVRFSIAAATAGAFVKIGSSADGFSVGVGNTTFDSSGTNFYCLSEYVAWHDMGMSISTGASHVAIARAPTSGNMSAYLDLQYSSSSSPGRYAPTEGTRIGGYQGRFPAAKIQAICVFAGILPAPLVWPVNQQMAYCNVNPDWSAWGRRRRYYYAPSAAAGNVGIYGKRGAVALPGGVRIEAVQ